MDGSVLPRKSASGLYLNSGIEGWPSALGLLVESVFLSPFDSYRTCQRNVSPSWVEIPEVSMLISLNRSSFELGKSVPTTPNNVTSEKSLAAAPK